MTTTTTTPSDGSACSPSSDTPETDFITGDLSISWYRKVGDLVFLARKMERERDKARKALREIVEITDRYSDSTLRTGVIKKVADASLSSENAERIHGANNP